MLRIWFDPLTPKQALFCQKIANRFAVENFDIVYTTRDYPEAVGRLELLGIHAEVIGRHGGADRYEKLLASGERVVELAKYIQKVKPDIGFAFASPESARVAYGLGIPYYTANDSPHSQFVAHLTIPFAETLFTPWIMLQSWHELGIPKHKIVHYHGLDPVAWLEDFTPNPEVLTELGLEPSSEYVVIRPEEAQASYLHGLADEANPVTNPVISKIVDVFPELAIIVLCRYKNQREAIRKRYGNHIIMPDKVVDAPSLLSSSILLVGAGGTMNQEASLLGVPVISCYPGGLLETEELLMEKQLLYRLPDSNQAAEKAIEIIKNKEKYLQGHHDRAQKLLKEMENPAEVISSHILNLFRED